MIGNTRTRLSSYPLAIGIVIGVLVGGLAFRLAAREPLETTVASGPGAASDGFATRTTSGGTTSGGTSAGGTTAGGAVDPATGLAPDGSRDSGGAGTAGPTTPGGGTGVVPAGTELTASDVGVTPTEITLVVGLIDLGAVGLTSAGQNPRDQRRVWDLFIADQNQRGGVAGRQIVPEYVTTSLDTTRDAATQQREACLRAMEHEPFFVFGTAFDPRCVTVENGTPLLTQSPQPDAWYAQAQGRLISPPPTLVRSFAAVARGADLSGRLQGATNIGVVVDDTDAVDAMERGLIPRLESLGYEIGYVAKMPADAQQAQAQAQIQATQMRQAGVDVVIGLTQILAWISFVNSADSQQWHPQYIVSDYGALSLGSFNSAMPESYAGTIAVSYFQFGPNHPEPPRTQACRERYMQITGEELTREDSSVAWKIGACLYLEMIADAINAAGPNPTRAGVGNAVQTLTARDYFSVLGGSFGPGKTDYQDIARLMQWGRADGTNTTGCNARKTHCWNENGPAFDPAQ